MARMLADRDSTDLHLNLARRHQRLARRAGLADLVAAIQPAIAALAAKQAAAADKDLDRQGAYDEILAADADLDDAIRNRVDSWRYRPAFNISIRRLISSSVDAAAVYVLATNSFHLFSKSKRNKYKNVKKQLSTDSKEICNTTRIDWFIILCLLEWS